MSGLIRGVQQWYQRGVYRELAKYGLYYEDVIIETTDVQEALKRLPDEVVQARFARLRRASDLGIKREVLPAEEQAAFDPSQSYLSEALDRVIKERQELDASNQKLFGSHY